MKLDKENMKKIMTLILFTLFVLVALLNYRLIYQGLVVLLKIIFPFALGAAMAFVINVPMHFFEKVVFAKAKAKTKNNKTLKKIARPASLLFALIFVIGILAIVIFVVVPQLGTTMMGLGTSIQLSIVRVQDWAIELFRSNQDVVTWINSLEFNWDKMIQTGIDFFRTGASSILSSTFSAAMTIVSAITNFVIAFVFACYILLQKERLTVQVRKVLYAFLSVKAVKAILDICTLSYKTFSNFVTGQCVEAVILGTMFFISMTILRLPYALLVGVLISFSALIPVFGAAIGCVIGTFLILMVSPMQALVFVILFLVLQQIEGNLIYPHVVGGSVGLPSIWVLMAVTIGGSLMGLVGMLIFIPLASVVYTIFRGFVYKRLKERNLKMDEVEGKQ